MRGLLLSIAITLTIGLPASGASPLSVRTHPFGFVPQHHPMVDITVHIDPNPDNRSASLMVDNGADYFSASSWEVWGEKAPTYYNFRIGPLPDGEYAVVVELVQNVKGQQRVVEAKAAPLSVNP